jgi:MtrB/PioB family decaheme-associated outer membrane protein
MFGGSEMKSRSKGLKARTIFLLASAMAISAGPTTGVWAGDDGTIWNAPPADQGWYFHGGMDVGGRGYIERPGSGFGRNSNGTFLLPKQTESIAKYEEYGKIPAGAFLDWIYLDVGSNDGRYRYNFLGKDVGYNAQSYEFDFSEAGTQYLTLGWDQTPHLYSTSAKSLFSGVGSTNLTVNNTVQTNLQSNVGNAALNNLTGLNARKAINNIIDGNATHIDEIGIDRDTFSAGYRYTPTPNWDFNASYEHLDRTGTQPGTLNWGYQNNGNPPGFPSNVISLPIPVDDTTQTPKASGEYSGANAFGKFSMKFAYAGSFYSDHLTTLDAENPFCITCVITGSTNGAGPNLLRLGLPPSNSANAFTFNGMTELPNNSRFTTTDQWSVRKQNEPFIQSPYASAVGLGPLPASSLNGEVNTFLTNNVLTTAFTENLHNKVRVRLYNYVNDTTVLNFGSAILADSEKQVFDADEALTPEYLSYTKTNVNEDLTYKPWRWLTLGAGYGLEHWGRSGENRFVAVDNENIASGFFNVQLASWAQWRGSYSYGWRRYDSYHIDEESWLNARMFDLANRDQQKARTSLNIDVSDAISIMPNAGLRWDDYPDTIFNQLGLHSDHSWNAGIDVGWAVMPTLRLTAGYSYEQDKLDISAGVPNAASPATVCNSTATGTTSVPPGCTWSDNLTQTYNTVFASADWKAIPSKLDFRVNYIGSWETESHDFVPCPLNQFRCDGVSISNSVSPSQVGLPWPENKAFYQRVDVTGRYYFDKDTIERLGLKGQVIAKLRYTVEHNEGTFWQSDAVNAYFGTLTGNTELTGASRSTFLAYNNPNYTVQLIAASLLVKW